MKSVIAAITLTLGLAIGALVLTEHVMHKSPSASYVEKTLGVRSDLDTCTDTVGMAVHRAIRDTYPYVNTDYPDKENIERAKAGIACVREWLKTAKLDPEQRESFECWLDHDERWSIPEAYKNLAHPPTPPKPEVTEDQKVRAYLKEHPVPHPQCAGEP